MTPIPTHNPRTVGLTASAAAVALSLIIALTCSVEQFNGVVSFVALCCIPVQIALALYVQLGGRCPGNSPMVKGSVLLATNLVIGGLASLLIHWVVAKGWGMTIPPTLAMFCITCVVVGLWLAEICQGWPFTRLRNPLLAAGTLLFTDYVITWLLFHIFFTYAAFGLPTSPGLRAAPTGMFEAWHALTFLVTFVSGLFLGPAFNFSFLPRGAAARALVNTLLCLIWAIVLFGVGVGLLHVDVVEFLVHVPVPMLFGGLIVVKMCRGQFYAGAPRSVPARGLATLVTAFLVGLALVLVYGALLRLVHGGTSWGAPQYTGEVWVAGACLALTFPLLNVASDDYELWPFTQRLRPHPNQALPPHQPQGSSPTP